MCGRSVSAILRPKLNAQAINFISSLTEGQPIVSDVIEIIPNLLRVSTPVLLTRRTVENYLVGVLNTLEISLIRYRYNATSLQFP
jgi:hypothetical protein